MQSVRCGSRLTANVIREPQKALATETIKQSNCSSNVILKWMRGDSRKRGQSQLNVRAIRARWRENKRQEVLAGPKWWRRVGLRGSDGLCESSDSPGLRESRLTLGDPRVLFWMRNTSLAAALTWKHVDAKSIFAQQDNLSLNKKGAVGKCPHDNWIQKCSLSGFCQRLHD